MAVRLQGEWRLLRLKLLKAKSEITEYLISHSRNHHERLVCIPSGLEEESRWKRRKKKKLDGGKPVNEQYFDVLNILSEITVVVSMLVDFMRFVPPTKFFGPSTVKKPTNVNYEADFKNIHCLLNPQQSGLRRQSTPSIVHTIHRPHHPLPNPNRVCSDLAIDKDQ
ncbi:hypothetical protein GBF38_007376 [Nibea albiflora]|uniref:Uncharacterized protein n=1 Tax=Nibea albiflora TaxID=240163 RepID=A0ACB7EHN7_NIBAL|nr:hypothetical protein GBF38_007376 [Nibea albiflora]